MQSLLGGIIRLLLNLRSLQDSAYDLKYYHKAQGFVYNQLKNTDFEPLHNKSGYKFFCFSNIFPFTHNIKTGEKKNWIISSPSKTFIETLKGKLEHRMYAKMPLNMGEMRFSIEGIKTLKSKVKPNCWIDTATPVVIRIPAYNYTKYGMTQIQYQNGAFWRPEHSFEAFVKQVEDNLYKKFEEFFDEKISEKDPLIEAFKFLKSTSNKVIISGKEQIIIGSIWNLKPSSFTKQQCRILNFGIETGVGERNSMGFGFVNVVRK